MGNSKYNHIENQKKWDKVWKDAKIYQPDLDSAKKPYYVLYMFPYPSAEGLHVGHAFSGTGADVYARFMRMKGYDVFHPMGFDAFGIHSENYALKINDHPKNLIDRATKHFREQFDSLGFSYDWTHSVNTSDPSYYKWTQWLFIQLFKAGLAEKKKAEVNWCPSCKTVLADEQVLQKSNLGVCERCGTEVERKELEQWFFKITDYADRLLEGLDRIDWTEKVKIAQRNWIGRKEGINIEYEVESKSEKIIVFTTRPDTNFGATFIALAPEHPLVMKLTTPENKNKVSKYIEKTKNKTEQERIEEGREKTGQFTGAYAINNLTGEKMPIWVSDFVLMGYGTGALVGVPGHDKRDFQFAQKFGLPVKRVVVGKDGDTSKITSIDQVQEEEGTMINSDFLNGLEIHEAIKVIMNHIVSSGFGKREMTYHLRDWLISRQRYWGAPIPMIFCEKCGWQAVPEEDLPVLLPYIENFKPLGIHSAGSGQAGVGPLAQDEDFVNTKCPNCEGIAKRETDVADTFLDSSWYFLRYPSASSGQVPFEPKLTKKWLPVNSYIGGAEHSVLHLLYSRFVTKVLFDLKLLDFDEPFTKFRAHGLIIKDGSKMSKSRGNVVNPDEYINKYGADALRCYLMFLGPFDQGGDFRDSGIEGMEKFLKRIRKLVEESILASPIRQAQGKQKQSKEASARFSADSKIEKSLNRTIKEVGDDVESLRYNTALAKIMEYVNDLNVSKDSIVPEYVKPLVVLLAPFAPYLAEELWEQLNVSRVPQVSRVSKGENETPRGTSDTRDTLGTSVHVQPWPIYDENKLSEDEVIIAVQVNGKLRAILTINNLQLTNKKLIEEKARGDPKVSKYIENKQIKKVIYVPGKILNFVIENS